MPQITESPKRNPARVGTSTPAKKSVQTVTVKTKTRTKIVRKRCRSPSPPAPASNPTTRTPSGSRYPGASTTKAAIRNATSPKSFVTGWSRWSGLGRAT
jgi:hypothetical protein